MLNSCLCICAFIYNLSPAHLWNLVQEPLSRLGYLLWRFLRTLAIGSSSPVCMSVRSVSACCNSSARFLSVDILLQNSISRLKLLHSKQPHVGKPLNVPENNFISVSLLSKLELFWTISSLYAAMRLCILVVSFLLLSIKVTREEQEQACSTDDCPASGTGSY